MFRHDLVVHGDAEEVFSKDVCGSFINDAHLFYEMTFSIRLLPVTLQLVEH